ncbi:MAG: S49 family peptidase [Candidatus Protochlamydia sp.]|nr:S49 family peptidase [Candidatus Protochlamydia sp.]
MRDSIFYSSLRALSIAFFSIIGICLGFLAVSILLGSISSGTKASRLTSVHSEEILPDAEGKREVHIGKVPVVLQIDIEGVIGLDALTTQKIRQLLVESREGDYEDNRVKAVLLYINTPGGTVTDANGIFQALKDYKAKYNVPIYAYVDGLCASGGMYIALAADKIYSSDVSLIGSVGVIAPTFMNFSELLGKVGVETLTISAGKDKDALNPLRPWKPGEEENYKQIVDYYYDHFVNLVTTNRPEMSKEKLVQDYGAKIFPADEAHQYGFIDVSNVMLSDALKQLVEKAGIEGEKYQVIRLESKGWWDSLFSAETPLLTGKIKHQLTISPSVDLMLENQFLYLYYPL